MHSDENYLSFPTGEELAERGYYVLCANTICKEGIIFSLNEKLQCVKAAILYLKQYPGIEKVILMGHSGGATLMSAYQAIAENAPTVFQTKDMIFPYPYNESLVPADGLLLLDSNWGNSVMQLFSLDPAVKNEENGREIEPALDLYRSQNGFHEEGSAYSREFIRKFQEMQGKRNNRILEYALERLKVIEDGNGKYLDDEPLIIPGSAQSFFNNKLFPQDIHLMSHTKMKHPLIHKDGSITNEIVYSVRKPENPNSFTQLFWEGARFLSVKTYLSSFAIRTMEDYGYDEDHVWGVDWMSTYSAPPGNVAYIKVPTLVMGMTGGWEYLASETIYDMSASEDKQIAFIDGASHKFEPAKAYETYPGQFGDTMKLLHDYVDQWIDKKERF